MKSGADAGCWTVRRRGQGEHRGGVLIAVRLFGAARDPTRKRPEAGEGCRLGTENERHVALALEFFHGKSSSFLAEVLYQFDLRGGELEGRRTGAALGEKISPVPPAPMNVRARSGRKRRRR